MKLSNLKLDSEFSAYKQKRTILLKPEVSPLVAYLTLRDLFGPPNGDIDPIKSRWCYQLSDSEAMYEIYDYKFETWSLAIFHRKHDTLVAEKLGDSFLSALRKASERHKSHIQKLAKETSHYVLENPFRLYYNSASSLLESAKNTNIFDSGSLCLAALFLFISSFEGFMNLLYELYLDSALRDDRISDRLRIKD